MSDVCRGADTADGAQGVDQFQIRPNETLNVE